MRATPIEELPEYMSRRAIVKFNFRLASCFFSRLAVSLSEKRYEARFHGPNAEYTAYFNICRVAFQMVPKKYSRSPMSKTGQGGGNVFPEIAGAHASAVSKLGHRPLPENTPENFWKFKNGDLKKGPPFEPGAGYI
jgi:hypothetical protein